jgi:tryptophan synthase alpha subunit
VEISPQVEANANNRQPALVTYITAGFPKAESTVDIMLGMEAGGAGMWLSVSAVRLELTMPGRRY